MLPYIQTMTPESGMNSLSEGIWLCTGTDSLWILNSRGQGWYIFGDKHQKALSLHAGLKSRKMAKDVQCNKGKMLHIGSNNPNFTYKLLIGMLGGIPTK